MTETPLALELKRRMEMAGFNQKSLALAADLNETYVRDILKGKSKSPEATRLSRIAATLGCRVSDLLHPGSGNKSKGGWAVTFTDDPAKIVQTPEEAEWIGAWRDMNEPQQRRAIALVKAMIDADSDAA